METPKELIVTLKKKNTFTFFHKKKKRLSSDNTWWEGPQRGPRSLRFPKNIPNANKSIQTIMEEKKTLPPLYYMKTDCQGKKSTIKIFKKGEILINFRNRTDYFGKFSQKKHLTILLKLQRKIKLNTYYKSINFLFLRFSALASVCFCCHFERTKYLIHIVIMRTVGYELIRMNKGNKDKEAIIRINK